jgi:hypothetical protein
MRVWGFIFFIFSRESRATKYREYKNTNGFDHRPQVPESTLIRHYLIPKFFEKKRFLDILENPRVPLHTKIRMLPTKRPEAPNVRAGGLLKDWAFDMEETTP